MAGMWRINEGFLDCERMNERPFAGELANDAKRAM